MGRNIVAALLPLSLALGLGCQSESYMSSIALTGAESRDDLAATVRKCLERQTACVTELTEARRMLLEVQGTSAGAPSATYQALRNQVDVCAKGVDAYRRSIDDVRTRSEQLFTTWTMELEQFSSDQMRASSNQRLEQARSGYALLDEELAAVLEQMSGLLDTHKDYVLFFNHNLAGQGTQEMLNAENERFEARMTQLAKDCEVTHRDAAEFLQRLRGAPEPVAKG